MSFVRAFELQDRQSLEKFFSKMREDSAAVELQESKELPGNIDNTLSRLISLLNRVAPIDELYIYSENRLRIPVKWQKGGPNNRFVTLNFYFDERSFVFFDPEEGIKNSPIQYGTHKEIFSPQKSCEVMYDILMKLDWLRSKKSALLWERSKAGISEIRFYNPSFMLLKLTNYIKDNEQKIEQAIEQERTLQNPIEIKPKEDKTENKKSEHETIQQRSDRAEPQHVGNTQVQAAYKNFNFFSLKPDLKFDKEIDVLLTVNRKDVLSSYAPNDKPLRIDFTPRRST